MLSKESVTVKRVIGLEVLQLRFTKAEIFEMRVSKSVSTKLTVECFLATSLYRFVKYTCQRLALLHPKVYNVTRTQA